MNLFLRRLFWLLKLLVASILVLAIGLVVAVVFSVIAFVACVVYTLTAIAETVGRFTDWPQAKVYHYIKVGDRQVPTKITESFGRYIVRGIDGNAHIYGSGRTVTQATADFKQGYLSTYPDSGLVC